ncbi:MAG: hypothetical protein DRJ10_01905 [Bacteroidetes bacterium]|nr:MAG: hypothetical protein DRI74_08895 [Bacteroidota bacterium]RLD84163.1 MAG: hypothetical protein DRJ10_01905 [Bacteroidota bacterium]
MATISSIPEDFITEHINWHSKPGNPNLGGRKTFPFTPDSGEEFLVWHHSFIKKFRKWAEKNPDKVPGYPDSIRAWTEIPPGLKMSIYGWNFNLLQDERLLDNMSNFGTLDILGIKLEWGIHSFLHNAARNMYDEPILMSFESPRSTYFWQLHGLIDLWREKWEETKKNRLQLDPDAIQQLIKAIRRNQVPFPNPFPQPPEPPFPSPMPQIDPSIPFQGDSFSRIQLNNEELEIIRTIRTFRNK